MRSNEKLSQQRRVVDLQILEPVTLQDGVKIFPRAPRDELDALSLEPRAAVLLR